MTDYSDKRFQVPGYAGVNIQIFNPAVNMGQQGAQQSQPSSADVSGQSNAINGVNPVGSQTIPSQGTWSSIPQGSVYNNNNEVNNNIQYPYPYPNQYPVQYPQYPQYPQAQFASDVPSKINLPQTTNTQKKKVVVLTDEYIRSLENYLNNPNRELRLHASKEIVKRFEEDSSRFNDPALNALLNKMLQDPQASIRGIGLSLVSTGTAQGNDFTMQILNQMKDNKMNPEDALQASEALLQMAAKTEFVNVPVKQLPQKEGINGYRI